MKVVSCRPAWRQTSNRFTQLFSEAVQQSGWTVREFSWGWRGLFAPRVVLIHWPGEMLTPSKLGERAKVFSKLALLHFARNVLRTRFVWLVHETQPHDDIRTVRWSTRSFLSALDGTIYLSHASRRVSIADIPDLAKIPYLVTRHGHYRKDLETAEQPRRSPGQRLELVYFGQIRPYKNLDGLIRAASKIDPDAMRIRIVGWSKDPAFTRELEALAKEVPAISLDIRDTYVPQVDLEDAINSSDGVVLPYRNILNSGAALLALSCNRPVLAPRLGSLPELQDEIGRDWVSLYDGDINESHLRNFDDALRRADRDVVDMPLYEWPLVGESIGEFLDQLSTGGATVRASDPNAEAEHTWR